MTTSPLRFFHGTHSGNLEAIGAQGLSPQREPDSAMRGNLSTLHDFTEHLVFLAPDLVTAAFYANAQAEHAGQKPVVFSVLIHDKEKLSVSDDYVIEQAIKSMLKVAGLPPLEFDEDGDVSEWGASTAAFNFWREVASSLHHDLMEGEDFDPDSTLEFDSCDDTLESLGHEALAPDIWLAMRQAVQAARIHPWQQSIDNDRDPAVGFRGSIASDHLVQVDAARVKHAISQISRGTGNLAQWDLDPSDHESHGQPRTKKQRKP